MKVNAKGQITIPAALRRRTGMEVGTEVTIREDGGRVVVERAEPRPSGREIVARMAGQGKGALTTDVVLSMTRGDR